jgi:hypothetical protein
LFSAPYPARPDGVAMIFMLGVITAIAPLSIDLYLPALPLIEQAFAVSPMLVQQSLSLFLLVSPWGKWWWVRSLIATGDGCR